MVELETTTADQAKQKTTTVDQVELEITTRSCSRCHHSREDLVSSMQVKHTK